MGGAAILVDAIRAERLDLVSLDVEALEALARGDWATAEALVGASGMAAWQGEQRLLQMRRNQIVEDEGIQPWLLRAMVLRSTGENVGHIGFHVYPDHESLTAMGLDGSEFGYTVFEAYRRRGYAREAALAMMGWAHETQGVSQFVLAISPGNVASIGLAAGLGFVKVGSHVDEVDGVEDVFALRVGEEA